MKAKELSLIYFHSEFHVGVGFGKLVVDTYAVKGKPGIKPGNGGDGGVGGIGGTSGSGLIIALNGLPNILFYDSSGNLKEYRFDSFNEFNFFSNFRPKKMERLDTVGLAELEHSTETIGK